ncbi:MAG: Gfo/Idh/MocA family oxidoreductase [Candidatus Omnitrophica bacterium]|nr:Gfo/Idh/MocA family oxidoreductase [bacterium]MBK7496818.1 Gfo/Idh/MocA family oxidoreductase [Candidatus Omnitrophota bacterium]MCE7907389.1 gfo/Idh/MocA family oxidoreductase [Candidatus Omnitrophica bacterium COP1]MBV6481440.1 1,5-anhydro-D-fructose reductase [bacterium]MCC6732434.1 Gfo/Idh/MocA family oxidoreductase [Candidatus Omnitrophota bacterium]
MTLGIAVLGWAHGHVNLYADEISRMEDAKIITSWDHDRERGERNGAQFGCGSTTQLEEALNHPGVEAVIVAAETSLHPEVCAAAANAGKHIILQKPMALSLEGCDQIIEAVRRNKVRFSLAWQMRVDPQNLKIREILEQGLLGKVVMFRRKHCLATHIWPDFDKTWHVKPELNRGLWMDDAAHPFDLVLWLFGKPRSVFAEIDTLLSPKIPDDNGIAVFRTQTGAIVEVVSSFTANAGENNTEIHGDKGTLLQFYGDAVSTGTPRRGPGPSLCWLLNGEPQWTDSGIQTPSSHADRLRALTRPMVDCLKGTGAPIATAEEGREVTEMLLASYESALTGRRIDFPFKG